MSTQTTATSFASTKSQLILIKASGVRLIVGVFPGLAAVVRREMHPIIIDAIPPIHYGVWVGSRAASRVAATAWRRTLACIPIRCTAIRASLNVADAAIAAVVVSLTLVTARGALGSGILEVICRDTIDTKAKPEPRSPSKGLADTICVIGLLCEVTTGFRTRAWCRGWCWRGRRAASTRDHGNRLAQVGVWIFWYVTFYRIINWRKTRSCRITQ